jgi:invasion protein IalB
MRQFKIAVCAFGIFLAASFPLAAKAQDQSPVLTPKSDLSNQSVAPSTTAGWSMLCKALDESKLACDINNAIYSGDSKQRFVGVTFNQGLDSKKKTVVQILVALPHGVRLETGVALRFDESEAMMLVPLTSDATGLFARGVLNAEVLAQATQAKQMSLAFAGLDGKDYAVRFEMFGLPALLKKAGLL